MQETATPAEPSLEQLAEDVKRQSAIAFIRAAHAEVEKRFGYKVVFHVQMALAPVSENEPPKET